MLVKYNEYHKTLMRSVPLEDKIYWYACKEETDFGTFYFEAPKPNRYLTTEFCGLEVIEPKYYWFEYEQQNEGKLAPMWKHSYKSVKRFLKKHTEIKVAVQHVRWCDCNIIFVRKGVK